jgi:hypothetical protein
MPWPIPTLRSLPDPAPLRWRNWIAIFVLTMLCGATWALNFWPHGKTGNQFELGMLAIGAPVVAFLAMLGTRLTYYGRAKLRHDVWEKARLRLASDWQRWSRRFSVVTKASVFLPSGLHASAWLEQTQPLPVNLNRCVSLGWTFANTAEQWVTHLFGLVVERFVQDISAIKGTFDVHVLLDATTYSDLKDCSFDAARIFASSMKMAGFEAGATFVLRSATAVDQIDDWIDRELTSPLLVVAGQRSPPDGPMLYSEGACALLLCPKAASANSSMLQLGRAATRAFRPMISNVEALKADVPRLLLAQSTPDVPIDVWHTGLDGNAQGVVLTALSVAKGGMAASERDMQQNGIDEVLGIAGPVSSWIALSLAVHAAPRRGRSQLIASASSGKSMVIFVVSQHNVD